MEESPRQRPRNSGVSSQVSSSVADDQGLRKTTSAPSLSGKSTVFVPKKPSKAEVAKARPAPAKWYVKCSGRLVENTAFISLTTILTLYALTGDDIRVLLTEKPADIWFNGMVLACLAIFTFEIIISVMGKSDYWLGFFFVLDVISTATLLLDLTWVDWEAFFGGGSSDSSESEDADSGSLRSGRTARIGAKAARMVRVLRLVRILKLYKALYEADRKRKRRRELAARGQQKQEDDDDWDEDDAAEADEHASAELQQQESTLGKKLSEMTTRRVIILILVMLILLPLLQADEITQLPFSSQYGANVVMNAFKDYEANTSSREYYQRQMLHYVYYHNWYAGKGLSKYCPYGDPSDLSCSSRFWGHLYYIGIVGQDVTTVDAKAAAAQLDPAIVQSFDVESRGQPEAVYNYGVMPSQVQTLLSSEWTTTCGSTDSPQRGISLLAEDVNGDVHFPVACPQDLRDTDTEVASPWWQSRSNSSDWRFEFYFDIRPYNKETAWYSLATTGFVLVLLLTASLMFSRDANRLIVNPVEQMIRRVKAIRDNPLIAMKMANQEFKLEEIKKSRMRKKGWFQRAAIHVCSCRCMSASKEGPMETVILEKTIIKLGSLLALGFGEAGANIISHNMKGSDSAGVNAVVPGTRVDCVIGVCRVLDFSTATEVLQGRIMTFVNQIAEIIHGVVDEFHGAPNKNSGEQFLVIWRMDNAAQAEERRRIAEMSIVAFCKILGALHRSALLADYRTHPGLQYRLSRNGQLSSQTRVNLSFGIHAGWAIEGAVGSEFKIDASYVSPNVSIASSVERCTQVYGVSVIVAQSCMELCSPELLEKTRLIDRVIITGSPTPMQLYCVDLDYISLEVDWSARPEIPLNTKNRYRARQFIESQKEQKLGEEFRIVTAFEDDKIIQTMRERYTTEFFQLFNMGYQNYSQGEWLVARRMLMETKNLLEDVEDGPSVALLRFMEEDQFEAPKDWRSTRDLSTLL
mmetsp:Transcript_24618/g.57169  ORF Transcript_24618/g.57169 Transcript_24618/m.57169 type:complete len:975 (+) Transcript_24618:54-2978(+)